MNTVHIFFTRDLFIRPSAHTSACMVATLVRVLFFEAFHRALFPFSVRLVILVSLYHWIPVPPTRLCVVRRHLASVKRRSSSTLAMESFAGAIWWRAFSKTSNSVSTRRRTAKPLRSSPFFLKVWWFFDVFVNVLCNVLIRFLKCSPSLDLLFGTLSLHISLLLLPYTVLCVVWRQHYFNNA